MLCCCFIMACTFTLCQISAAFRTIFCDTILPIYINVVEMIEVLFLNSNLTFYCVTEEIGKPHKK